MRRVSRRRASALLTVSAVATLVGVLVGGPATAQPTTTTAPTTTTTVAPTTTTTSLPPTTTTTTAPTTTTTHRTTTTTEAPTTTSTTAASAASSSTPWGWIVLGIVVVLAIVLVALLLARNRRRGKEAAWGRSVLPALTAAELARELVLTQSSEDDPQRRASVGVQVDEAVSALDRAADSAPGDEERALCARCSEASVAWHSPSKPTISCVRAVSIRPVNNWRPRTPPGVAAPPNSMRLWRSSAR